MHFSSMLMYLLHVGYSLEPLPQDTAPQASAQSKLMMRNDLAGGYVLPLRWCWGRRRARGPWVSFYFLSLLIFLFSSHSFFHYLFLMSLCHSHFSVCFSHFLHFQTPPFFSASKFKAVCVFPLVTGTKVTQVKKQWCTSWVEMWRRVILHEGTQEAWLLPDAAACAWTKTTHRCNPYGLEATPSF